MTVRLTDFNLPMITSDSTLVWQKAVVYDMKLVFIPRTKIITMSCGPIGHGDYGDIFAVSCLPPSLLAIFGHSVSERCEVKGKARVDTADRFLISSCVGEDSFRKTLIVSMSLKDGRRKRE